MGAFVDGELQDGTIHRQILGIQISSMGGCGCERVHEQLWCWAW